jgi:hypothetical protein
VLLNCLSADTKCQAIGQIHVCTEINFQKNIQYHLPTPTPQKHSASDLDVYGSTTRCWGTTQHFYMQRRNISLSWSYQYRCQVCVSRYPFSGYCLTSTAAKCACHGISSQATVWPVPVPSVRVTVSVLRLLSDQYRSQVCVSPYQFSGYCLKHTETAPWHHLPRTLTVHSVAEEFRGCHRSRFIFVFTILTSTAIFFYVHVTVHRNKFLCNKIN